MKTIHHNIRKSNIGHDFDISFYIHTTVAHSIYHRGAHSIPQSRSVHGVYVFGDGAQFLNCKSNNSSDRENVELSEIMEL